MLALLFAFLTGKNMAQGRLRCVLYAVLALILY